MNAFTWVFLVTLLATTAIKIWLAQRHAAYVRGHRDRVPAQFADRVALEQHQKAADYTCAKARLTTLYTAVDALVLLILTLGGVILALDGAWRGWLGEGIWRGVALIASVIVVGALIDLPFSLYRTFVIESKFGFNKMTLKLFFSDLVKQTLIGAALGLPILLAVLWMMQRLGWWWWLYAWVALTVFSIFIQWLYPVVIAPLFNKFKPMENAELRERIERLLAKCGFRASGLFVMDGSLRSSHGNAYFTGFGKTKRVVFFDTLLATLNGSEVEAVLAHELGHFKLRHVVKATVLSAVVSLVFLFALNYLMQQEWFFSGLNAGTPDTAMALTLFMLSMPLFTFVFQPLLGYYSRRREFEADDYAAKHAEATDLVTALVKLYRENASTLTPDPLHSAFYDSHPPAAVRIARLQAAR